jgi:hypothetical protein
VRQRCFALWTGRGNRNASRVAWLFRQELADDTPGPAPSTVRRWATQEDWQSWAGEEAPALPGRDLHQWTTMWRRHVVRQVEAALTAQRVLLLGTFDGDPAAAEEAFTEAACSMTDLLAQPSVRGLLRVAFSEEEAPPVFFAKRERLAWERLVQRKTES